MNEREALVLLNAVEGIGPVRLKKILTCCESVQSVFGKTLSELEAIGIPGQIAASVLEAPKRIDVEREFALALKEDVQIVTAADAAYPKALKEIPDAPAVLYVKGALNPGKELYIAIVGSRKASRYGLDMAERFSGELVSYGFTVVSGLALGIDAAAHQGALEAQGRTVAVLGGGLMQLYPLSNVALAQEIAQSGALVSEFPMRYPALPQNFPRRNRVISGLAMGVLVVEAGEKSGALITARCAIEQGREVFALPGRVDSPLSKGTHRLIQDGAKLVQEITDIFEELKIPILHEGASRHPFISKSAAALSEEEEVVYEILTELPKPFDAIVGQTHLSPQKALSSLVQLEIKKLVRTYPGNHYARK
ncbi:MAG: DNA-processing protein DprA [Candidatus Omnitrophota bacterium]